ncbi:jg10775 [Pararge aegeria aegeria]|uniref:Jg10775 protein n=1 Tax=Pararge aegeria aegeria TaxID=348720 RepID=A0A8S4S853_9NEOP|nr:jg10775 [Pararge aegeria aegeria]
MNVGSKPPYGPHKKAQSHSAGDGEIYAWSIVTRSNQKCGYSWKNQSHRHSKTSREAEVAMGRAYNSEKGWTLGSQGAGCPELVSATLFDP